MNGDTSHAPGWTALIADVLARPGRSTFFAALERPLRTDVRALVEAAWDSEVEPDEG